MCGRLACTLEKDDLISACQYNNKSSDWVKPQWIGSCYDYRPFYNGPPTTNIAVLTSKHHFPESETDVCIVTMRWGLMPTHIPEGGLKTLHTHNARCETILQSPLYKPCLAKGQRCIVIVEGYYEWQTAPGQNNKQPYYVHYDEPNKSENSWKGKKVLKLAGIFNKTIENGVTKYSCTIITKESDETLSWMHHRMPIFLHTEEDAKNWLNYQKIKETEAVTSLLTIHPSLEVKFYPVEKSYVNKSNFDDKKCMERISLKRKSNVLTNWLITKKPKTQ